MRVLDLFSGIGGFSLGLERAGMTTVAFCENDPFCRSVLAKHWPDLPIHSDIRNLDGYQYTGSVELVCGGFPCQPFSVAGKRGGASDDRALWPEMFRVIREVQPAWVVGENVPGIIEMELDSVLSDLAGEGYSCQTFVIPACALDAPHRRDRVWVVAHTGGKGESDAALDEREMASELVADAYPRQRNGADERVRARRNATDACGENVADASGSRSQGIEEKRIDGEVWAKPDNKQPDRFGGSSFWLCDPARAAIWEPEPGVGRMADGIPARVDRLRALGNAVVPQLVEEIGQLILACEAAK
jgi:DNA (cytosine-5)-methyltransferase 1